MTLDDLLGPVPESSHSRSDDAAYEHISNTMSSTVYDKNPSKSQRVRDYLDEQPDARNRDVVEALSDYGVTAADVSNAKAQLKRKGATSKRGRPAAAAQAAPSSPPKPSAANQSPSGSIAMNEIDAALNFVREIGSLDRAKQLLVIIQQIQQL